MYCNFYRVNILSFLIHNIINVLCIVFDVYSFCWPNNNKTQDDDSKYSIQLKSFIWLIVSQKCAKHLRQVEKILTFLVSLCVYAFVLEKLNGWKRTKHKYIFENSEYTLAIYFELLIFIVVNIPHWYRQFTKQKDLRKTS